MFRFLLIAFFLALATAFVPPLSVARSPLNLKMSEIVKAEEVKAPKSGWSLTMNGGARTIDDVRKAQEKAAKSYAVRVSGDVEVDTKRTEKGWTTK